MLLFSTILAINETMSKDAFILLVLEWNQNSPHRNNIVPNVDWNGEHNVHYGDSSLWLDIQEYRNGNVIAVRYEKVEDDGAIWDTDYVMNFTTMQMAVSLDRSYKADASYFSPDFSTPHFITMLIERGYLLDDCDLPTARTPMYITEANIELLAAIITEKAKYRLPIVYVSKTCDNENPIEVERLAARLKGVAHVLVQSDARLNGLCRRLTSDHNEYYGAIGIYYPNAAVGNRRFIYKQVDGYDNALYQKVLWSVIRYSNAQKVDPLYTWQGVSNALLTDRLCCQRSERIAAENARDKAETAIDDYATTFDAEFDTWRQRVDALARENAALRAENEGLRTKLMDSDSLPVLYAGEEDGLYVGEITDIVLSVLSDALKNSVEHSRRYDVIEDLLKSNTYTRDYDSRVEQIKHLLKGYDRMSKTLRQELIDYGFTISDDGKHHKLVYFGDSRYWTTLAKTASDYKSGPNSSAVIIRNML